MLRYIIGLIIIVVVIFLYLFRDPPLRVACWDSKSIVSPAYGKIWKIKEIGEHICIPIMLTVFDVHYQYMPCDGTVKSVTHDRNGIFNIVRVGNYGKTNMNEKMIHEIKMDNGRGTLLVYQIAGRYFRRIKSYLKEGDEVEKGDHLGLIKMGSRVDLYVPKKGFTLKVRNGMSISGGDLIGVYD